jgi:hypothetical protein
VIDLKRHRSGRSVTYRPEIEFTTNTGQVITVVYATGSNPPMYSTGQKVNIMYSKDNPENLVIDSKSAIFVFPIILILSGAILFFLDIRIAIKSNRRY